MGHPSDVYIVDGYNAQIYPGDTFAASAIDLPIHFKSGVSDAEYLSRVDTALDQAFTEFSDADIVLYNAGSDILERDPLGAMNITAKAIHTRDQMVFGRCLERKIPVVYLLSGGYQKNNAAIIADSVHELHKKFGLFDKDKLKERMEQYRK